MLGQGEHLVSSQLTFFHPIGLRQAGLGFLAFGFTILVVLYAEVDWRTGRLRKMILYPVLDVARGLFFTFGGVTKLLKEQLGGRRKAQNF